MRLVHSNQKRAAFMLILEGPPAEVPAYLCSLITFKHRNYNVSSGDILTLAVTPVHTEL